MAELKMHGSCRGRTRKIPTFQSIIGFAFLSVVLFGESASAQDVCSCSPSSFEFAMNFSQTCPVVFETTPGLEDGACYVTSLSANITDFVPVEVQRISILETDEEGIPIAQSQLDGIYVDGETFMYSSISGLGGNASQIPTTLHLTITASNEDGRTLFQIMAIQYSNDCAAYPVLMEGEALGWTTFTDLGTPRGELCPPAATMTPTMSPTTTGPSSLPSFVGATPAPSVITSDSPTTDYTDVPTPMSFNYELDDFYDFGKKGKGGKSMKLKDKSKSNKKKSKKKMKSMQVVEDSADGATPSPVGQGGKGGKGGKGAEARKKEKTDKDMMKRVRNGKRYRRY